MGEGFRSGLSQPERLVLLNEVSQIATSTLDVTEMFQSIAFRLQEEVGFDRASIVFPSEDRHSVAVWLSVGRDLPGVGAGEARRLPRFFGPLLDGRERCLQIDPSEHEDELARAVCRAGLRRLLHVALRFEDRTVGVLNHAFTRPEPRREEEEELLCAVADRIAPAVANARLHEEVHQKEALNRRLLEAIPDMLFRVQADGTVGDFIPGRGVEPLVPPEKLLGQDLYQLLPADVEAVARELVEQALAGGGAGPREYSMEQRGIERHFEARAVACGEEEVLILVRDTTESRRAGIALREAEQRLERAQRLEAIGRLAGGVAHDFNNLLTAIQTQCALLHRVAGDPGRVRSDVALIGQAASRAAQLTSQLLAFSRRQLLRSQVFEADEMVRSMAPLLRSALGEDVHLEVVTGAPGTCVEAERASIEQVLLNLAVNAADALPQGGRAAIQTREELGELVLVFSDTGRGMDRETAKRAFEPFFTTKEQGSGLGLATVYGIMTQSGGSVEIESEIGRGTSVELRLPLARTAAEVPSESPPDPPSGDSELVLLVEDEMLVREASRAALEAHGYRVIPAAGAAEAQRIFEEHGPELDLVVTDLVMPGESGGQLARRLRRQRPELRVLFMTGYAETEPSSGEQILYKPYDAAELLRAVAAALHRPH